MASRREGSGEEAEKFPLSESSKKAHDVHLSRLQSFVVPEKGKDDDTGNETLDPYSRFRRDLLLSVRPNEPQRRRVLWESLDLLENFVQALGLGDPDYYVLVAVHIFKNTTGTPNETEELNANAGLSKDPEIVRLLAQTCSHIRSLVGIKAWHEATSICWNLAHASGPADATNEPSKALPGLSQTEEKIRETAQRLKVEDMSFSDLATTPKELDTKAILIEGRKSLTHFNSHENGVQKLEVQAPEEVFADAEPGTSGSNSGIRLGEILQSVRDLFDEGATMAKALLELIEGPKTVDQLQEELIELLGFEQFELVGQILEFRDELRQQAKRAKLEIYKSSRMAESKAPENPNVGQSIVVQSSSQAELKKEIRREQKRNKREMSRIQNAFGEDELLELELAQKEQLRERQRELALLKWGPTIVAGQQPKEYALPEGSERRSHKNHEEVLVPAMQRDMIQDVHHIYVKDMDELGQLGFKGFEKLNVIQSIVFEQAYKTRENLLICAPTGAGKTNIAMLAILNTIHQHRKPDGTIMKDDFKMIYIAPMKALATEMTESFGKRLAPLGLKVRELTGDTQLTKKEQAETQMLVLTPEKWDVVTRKAGDDTLTSFVKLLIIDEVHLLHDDRGPVIETIVARTLRQVEMTQSGIRIVGLSATLPNYIDVASFLRVNPYKGLFFFDGRFRPVPLSQKFIGVKKQIGGMREQRDQMDEICYKEVLDFVRRGHQVLVFVHARNATATLAQRFRELAAVNVGDLERFLPPSVATKGYIAAKKTVQASRNGLLFSNFQYGMGIHHAGLQRSDRLLMEKMFAQGYIQVLFCTSTLAWGVNLPAHAVVIRGTDVFDSEKGAFTDLGVLDVQQIFGRAGRPQFENEGHGIIITQQKTLDKYLGMLIRQAPIESQFFKRIHDNLNAEIALGTVSTVDEAVEWLSYTYYHIRARINPIAYGLPHNVMTKDPNLRDTMTQKVQDIASQLDTQQMIRFDSLNGFLSACDLGRIASQFYIKYETIEMLNGSGQPVTFQKFMPDDMVVGLVAQATEFAQLKVREEEMIDLEEMTASGCFLPIRGGGLASIPGKVNCLLQCFISRCFIKSFSLASEALYVQQNATRLARAFFEISLRRGWANATNSFLHMSKCLEKRMPPNQSGLRQLIELGILGIQTVEKVERRRLSEQQLFDLSVKELGYMFSVDGQKLYDAIHNLPRLDCSAVIQPITNTIVQLRATVTPAFEWNDRVHGKNSAQSFWVTLENIDENMILHHERISFNSKKVRSATPQELVFTVPIRDRELSNNYQLRIASDYFVTEDTTLALSMHNCVLPTSYTGHTDLLPLDPLPITALRNPDFESIYPFDYFNPIQTQIFYPLYMTDESCLVGAPTGSGKTVCAELALFRLLQKYPGKKCVYVAPLKALVRERVSDWKKKFESRGYKVLELSGDYTPDVATLNAAPILITTPEKWDGVTRSWATREYVRQVGLIVIDEIHLLGVDRGHVLEAIVTRMKYLTRKSMMRESPARLLGLSTALANAGDVGEWMGIPEWGLFNFRPSVRPVPINVHISGFPGQHYCPRMALMNKPAFKAILSYSPLKPVIVFVASRRQTRLTALAFISMLVVSSDPRQWLKMSMDELEALMQTVRDENLKLTLPFGIGMHHAGLQPHERALVEQLFVDKKIQVLVATATLAWGINMPAHLVIVKGTEFFDGKKGKYVDFPVTDVLQMMGRAGRPQFDDTAVAVIYVQDVKKHFYKRFLYEPFPVESSLYPALANHVNAEINAGTITSKQSIMEYLAGTYFYRRLFANPNYYGIEEMNEAAICRFLSQIVDEIIAELLESSCITINEEDDTLSPTSFGRLSSIYYLEHMTIRFFLKAIRPDSSIEALLKVLTDAPEYAEIPVRHNEDQINAQLARRVRLKLPPDAMDSPHIKAHILFQAYFSRMDLQTDYRTDQRTVIDSSIRILQAMRDVCLLRGWLHPALGVSVLAQMCHTGRWWDDHPLLVLPHLSPDDAEALGPNGCTIPELHDWWGIEKAKGTDDVCRRVRREVIDKTTVPEGRVNDIITSACRLPVVRVNGLTFIHGGQETSLSFKDLSKVVRLPRSTACRVRLEIEALGPNRFNADACLPVWPKEKSAGWVCLFGDKDTGRSLASHFTASPTPRRVTRMELKTPDQKGRINITFFLISDCYLGLDQEYTIQAELF
ncbi:unnamed protein product, partial [Mesorhabditis spiculigera]